MIYLINSNQLILWFVSIWGIDSIDLDLFVQSNDVSVYDIQNIIGTFNHIVVIYFTL